MEYPQCVMKADELMFCLTATDQCTLPGNHRLWVWPDMPVCCWHYEHFVNRIHNADSVAAASQAKASEQETNHHEKKRLDIMSNLHHYSHPDLPRSCK
jgi:hypothetical protein